MVLKLYGANTPGSQRVATVLLEKQVPFEYIEIDLHQREQKKPEYIELHPFGQIPCIDDDGVVVYESRAICRYLATKYKDQGTKLIPSSDDLKEYAAFEQAVSSEAHNFDAFAAPATFEILVKPSYNQVPDPEAFKAYIEKLDAKLDVYDKILSKQQYIAGDKFTVVDIFHLPCGVQLSEAGSNIIDTKPNVARWFKEISSRPSWVSVKAGIESTI